MNDDALRTTLLDLAYELREPALPLTLGGGYGLFLKQLDRQTNAGHLRTLIPGDLWPPPRVTEDLDVFLRAEVLGQVSAMGHIRDALDRLGFVPIESAKYMQFIRQLATGAVKIDLLSGPVSSGDRSRIRIDSRRARPYTGKGETTVPLHARYTEEAIGIEEDALPLIVRGQRTSGDAFETTVYVPQPFTYLLMKLFAFRDRQNSEEKDFARHHAMDLYRVIAMLTEDENAKLHERLIDHRDDPVVTEAARIAAEHFGANDALGFVRLRQHKDFTSLMDPDRFGATIREILAAKRS